MTRPGNRMSWVKEVKLAMEGEREPASPGEPERPVPRVRVETRESEHVTPEKEEQGSGAVMSQDEKKSEPGMSVREALISASAARSTWLSCRDGRMAMWRRRRNRSKS